MNDRPDTERLHDALASAAADLALDPLDPTTIRGRATARRRRRRAILAGGVTVVAVTFVGAIVANRDNGDDTLEFATPTETTQPDHGGDGTAAVDPDVTPLTTPPTLPPVEQSTGSAFDQAAVAASPAGDVAQLLPWRDGFLRIGYEYQPQPLGPIPDEISALFPDEVRELFPDGLPPTIDEAMATLSDAGLLDEVTAVLADHPEASEAIYAADVPPPTLTASFTTDGAEWRTVELAPPVGVPGQFTVAGDRLVVWSFGAWNDVPESAPTELVIAATDDLVDWQSMSVDLGEIDEIDEIDDAAGVDADYVHRDVYVNGVAFVGDQWLARVERHVWVDYEALLPDDLRQELRNSQQGYGMGTGPDGLEIEIEQADGPATRYEFTWDELGLTGDPGIGFNDSGPNATLLLGTLGGSYETTAVPPGQEYGTVLSNGTEFLLLGQGMVTSTDGLTWSPVAGLPTDRYLNGAATLRGGDLILGEGEAGPEAWLRHADGSVTAVVLPELPGRYNLWNQNGSTAWIVDLSQGPGSTADFEPITVMVEFEGFQLSLTEGPAGGFYSLVDLASGDVRDGDFRPEDDASIWEYDEATGVGTVVIRDDAGNEIVRIPGELISDAYQAAYESTDAAVEVSTSEDWQPDLWLVATANGADWLTVDLDDPNPEDGYSPSVAAVNNGSVLYGVADGWVLAPLPSAG